MLLLALAHVVTSGLLIFVLGEIGRAIRPSVSVSVTAGLIAAVSTVGAVWDIRVAHRRTFSAGPKRQTAKALGQSGGEWWVTPLLWGADTGLIFTTYRVSFASWLLLLLSVLGVAPSWTGLVYGSAVVASLVIVIMVPRLGFQNPTSTPPHAMSARWAQILGVVSMAFVAVSVASALLA